MRKSLRVTFENARGDRLAGILDTIDQPKGYALFSHCFTCSKDLKAIVRISRLLAENGIAVLRYDYTGLGESQGVFEESNFSTTCLDTVKAAQFLSENFQAPVLLIGHSLGGTATYVVAPQIPSARGVVTIASPSCTTHLSDFLAASDPNIDQTGSGTVIIGNRPIPITAQLMHDLRSQNIPDAIRQLQLPLLLIHSPNDETLGYWHSLNSLRWTEGRSSLLTLPGSNHLLTNAAEDLVMVADSIHAWASRFIPG